MASNVLLKKGFSWDSVKYSDWVPVGGKSPSTNLEVNYVGRILTNTINNTCDINHHPQRGDNLGEHIKAANNAEKELDTMPPLAWPTEKWLDSREKAFRKHHAIVRFLERVWNPFIQETGAAVTREILKLKDPDAEAALTRHLERHPWPKPLLILYPEELEKLSAERPFMLRVDIMHKTHG